MSARRFFDLTRTHTGRIGAVIRCGKCGAAETTESNGANMPPEACARFFRSRGWRVAGSPKKDRCPACLAAEHSHKPPIEENETMGLSKDATVVEIRPPQPGASEQAPRQMTREDRRLIFAKLEEVYIDERVGYCPGWNDERVAKDMAVPRAWVETIREENFGPQKAEQSAEVIELRERIEMAELGGKGLADEAARIAKQAADARVAAAALEGRARDLLKGLDTLRADLKKLVGGR